MLDKAQHALDKAKVNMRRDLESNLEAYCQQVLQLREQVLIEIPTSQELTPDEAFAVIYDFRHRVEASLPAEA